MLADIFNRNKSLSKGFLTLGGTRMPCALGRGGIRAAKREGDGATPGGVLPFRRVFYRPDRVTRPQTGLQCHALTRRLGWCDDPQSGAYNQLIRLPFPASHELLWRADHLYDVVIELGYNDRPAIPRHGSAIFMHLAARDFAPTEGCIAVRYADMLRLLRRVQRGDAVRIRF
ncbi:MAG: L,D-transpeptidase family protein [Fimbriimonadaceae bacterium]|nr:L,D-transpeptidase family protein [Alphaproteobacteria bacterium]